MNDPDCYDIVEDEEPSIPGLKGRVCLCTDRFDLVDAMSAQLSSIAHAAVSAKGQLQLVLVSTEFTSRLVRSMLTDPLYRTFPWNRCRVWIGEQRRRGRSSWTGEIGGMLIGHGGLPEDGFKEFVEEDDCETLNSGGQDDGGADAGMCIVPRADCAVIGLECGWLNGRGMLQAHTGASHPVGDELDRGSVRSAIFSCDTIFAAGTMTQAHAIGLMANRIVHEHPDLRWFLSRAGLEEPR